MYFKLSLLLLVFDAAVEIHASLFLGTGVKGIAVTQSKAQSACLKALPLQIRTLPDFHRWQFVYGLTLPESSGVGPRGTIQGSGNHNSETLQ